MSEVEDQMGLFEIAGAADRTIPTAQQTSAHPVNPAPVSAVKAASMAKAAATPPAKAAPASATKPARAKVQPAAAPPALRKVSGLVPDGDVRLTANIRQDLHLRLKIASAHRRTTIGEIIEELIDAYI